MVESKPSMFYRPCGTLDPEERLEDAAMWKAMRDEFGDAIAALDENEQTKEGTIVFGRSRRFRGLHDNPVSPYLPYWTDPAFLENAGRSFAVLPFEAAMDEVSHLHAARKGAFLKSVRSKHAIFRVPVGVDPREEIAEMAFSFIDGGPELMVQELMAVEFEHRFFCVDREVATHSPVQWALTPLDRVEPGWGYRTPRDTAPVQFEGFEALADLAAKVARTMREPHAVVDCALFDGVPAVVEMNPMRIGECGLYACDVRRLAKASRKILGDRLSLPGETST